MKRLVLILIFNIGLSLFQANNSMAGLSQTAMACMAVNNFPVDYGSVWPTAVKKHNASPSTVSASGYMKGYIEVQKNLFKIKEKNALAIYDAYAKFWVLLENDLIANNGKIPQNASSIKFLSPLMKSCAKYGTG